MGDKKGEPWDKMWELGRQGRNRKRLESLVEDRQRWAVEVKMDQNGPWEFWVVVLRHVGLRFGAEWDLKEKQGQGDCGSKG